MAFRGIMMRAPGSLTASQRSSRVSARGVPVGRFMALSSLIEEIDNIPASVANSQSVSAIETSTLSNGVQVLSKATGAASAAMGVAVQAGSRFGSEGQGLLLKHMAFKGTKSRSDIRLARDIEEAGVSVGCEVGRENLVLSASGQPEPVMSTGVAAVAETLLSLKTVDWNVAEVKAEFVAKEIASVTPEQMLVDKIHAAAFGEESPLGQPLYTAGDSSVSGSAISAYLTSAITAPSGLTFVGAGGIAHADVVAQAEALFGGVSTVDSSPRMYPSPFVGGSASLKLALPSTRVAVAVPGAAIGSKDYATCLVLQELLGHGAFGFSYSDAGMVGLAGSTTPSAAGALAESFAAALTSSYSEAAVAVAKTALKTKMYFALEDASGCISGLAGAGVLAGDIKAVEAVTAASVKALTANTTPALATVGSASAVPAYNTLAGMF